MVQGLAGEVASPARVLKKAIIHVEQILYKNYYCVHVVSYPVGVSIVESSND